jgi:hypothetical protein
VNKRKEPLYRKVNTRARGVHHKFGGDFRNERRSKKINPGGMKKGIKRGLDYTPLFRFLLSKVGQEWNPVHSEAVSRLDSEKHIYWMVSKSKAGGKDYVMVGESSYYSGLYVDDDGILRKVAPEIGPETLEPRCNCCTHTFNGKKFTKKYKVG